MIKKVNKKIRGEKKICKRISGKKNPPCGGLHKKQLV